MKRILETNDSAIVAQVLQGDVNAFEHLLNRHRDLVLKIVGKHVPFQEVEGTTQDVFVRAFRSLSSYKGEGVFSQWLSSIAIRTCYDYWRRAYRNKEVPEASLSEQQRNWLGGVVSGESERAREEDDHQTEARELLDWALSRMSAKDRMVIELLYLEELSVKEVADLLGFTPANIKVRAFRSRRKLEKLLRGELEKRKKTS